MCKARSLFYYDYHYHHHLKSIGKEKKRNDSTIKVVANKKI